MRPHLGGSASRLVLSGAVAVALTLMAAQTAAADELKFQFTNPSFGGNPFNSSHLLSVANAQNDNERPSTASQQSQADQFVRLLQSRLLSALASQVSDAILGENAQPSGQIVYGTQTVQWETLLDSIRLTITEADTGAVTVIEIPSLDGGG
jgi:curli production assembly/transport component CsgF